MTTEPVPRPTPEAIVAGRRQRLERLLGAPLVTPATSPLAPGRREHLRQQAEALYWEELSWERLTHEEGIGGHGLVEMAFPGLLAFVDGLLLQEARGGPKPRPEVVEDVLLFLARRADALSDGEAPEQVAERDAAVRLIDLVLYRLHGLAVGGGGRLQLAWTEDD